MSYLIALVIGLVVGAMLRSSRIERVYDSESTTLNRLREELEGDIKRREERLLVAGCGWSEGDRLRAANIRDRHILSLLGTSDAD